MFHKSVQEGVNLSGLLYGLFNVGGGGCKSGDVYQVRAPALAWYHFSIFENNYST